MKLIPASYALTGEQVETPEAEDRARRSRLPEPRFPELLNLRCSIGGDLHSGSLNAVPMNFGDFGVEDLDWESIMRIDDGVPLDLGIGGLVARAVPMWANLDFGREVATRHEASLVTLP